MTEPNNETNTTYDNMTNKDLAKLLGYYHLEYSQYGYTKETFEKYNTNNNDPDAFKTIWNQFNKRETCICCERHYITSYLKPYCNRCYYSMVYAGRY